MTAEGLARLFHEKYEWLAPSFGYSTRRESALPWESVPENNRLLMTATVQAVLDHLVDDVARRLHEYGYCVSIWGCDVGDHLDEAKRLLGVTE